jgi:ubiquinol-cytochrome c reductase cytochrome c1 subunit
MIKFSSIVAAGLLALGLSAPSLAQEDGHSSPYIERQNWSFAGIFGRYDVNQLQRGFYVFQQVCAGCHSARLLAFRNLHEEGGPEYSEEQVKALAATFQIQDASVEGGVRPGVAADRWPSPYASEQDARDANGGSLPPDLSVMAKARGTTQPGFWWILNYFTVFQEGGPDYIHALLNGYEEHAPEDVQIPEGKYYNVYFPGYAIGMAPPLTEGSLVYPEVEGQESVPNTVDQQSRDVAAFLMWMAEPHLNSRKETGFRVVLFLVLFAGLLWAVKTRLWRNVEH